MHRSNFRPRRRSVNVAPHEGQPAPRPPKDDEQDQELAEIKAQLANVTRALDPLAANVERLAVPKADISVPADIEKSLRLVHGRLDRLEKNQEQIEAQTQRMATTFSNAILKLADKVEKIAGGEDSSFSLAHSLEKLIFVLGNRKFRVVRDNDGNMVELETKA